MDLSAYLCQVLKGCIYREGQRMIGHIGKFYFDYDLERYPVFFLGKLNRHIL